MRQASFAGSIGVVIRARSDLAVGPDVLAGVSELPNDCGIVTRILGPSSQSVRAAVTNTGSEVRRVLLGAPAPSLRKG